MYCETFYLTFNLIYLLSFFSLYLQRAIVMDMQDDAVSVWTCTSYLAVYQVAFVQSVVIQQQVDIAITVKRDTIKIQRNLYTIVKFANVSK